MHIFSPNHKVVTRESADTFYGSFSIPKKGVFVIPPMTVDGGVTKREFQRRSPVWPQNSIDTYGM